MTARVMVIDDSMLVRRQVSAALKAPGYLVTEAVDGVDALEWMRWRSCLPCRT